VGIRPSAEPGGDRSSEPTNDHSGGASASSSTRNGVSERRTATGGLFGLEGIQRAIEGAGPSAAATTRAIQRAVADASPHPLEDDAAVLALAIT